MRHRRERNAGQKNYVHSKAGRVGLYLRLDPRPLAGTPECVTFKSEIKLTAPKSYLKVHSGNIHKARYFMVVDWGCLSLCVKSHSFLSLSSPYFISQRNDKL